MRPTIQLIFIWLAFGFSGFAQTEFVRVKVIDVHDGDTITVSDATKRTFRIRLIGIDTPELEQKDGEWARKELSKILQRDKKNVIVKTVKLDRFDRILAQVFVGEIDVNLELLKLGLAWIYELDWKVPKEYHEAFQKARKEKLGLFKRDEAIHPSEFRRQKKKS